MVLCVGRHPVLVVPGRAGELYETVLANNPTGYWRLGENGGTTAANSATSGSTYDGTAGAGVTLGGAAGALAGDSDKAASFVDAANSRVDINNSSSMSLDGAFTVEAWVNSTSTNETQVIASKWSMNGSDEGGFFMSLYNDGSSVHSLMYR